MRLSQSNWRSRLVLPAPLARQMRELTQAHGIARVNHDRHIDDALDAKHLSNDVGIPPKASSPIVVAEHHDGRMIFLVLEGEASSVFHPDPDAREEISAYLIPFGCFRQFAAMDGNASELAKWNICDQVFKNTWPYPTLLLQSVHRWVKRSLLNPQNVA